MMSQLLAVMKRLLKKGEPCIWESSPANSTRWFEGSLQQGGYSAYRSIDYDKQLCRILHTDFTNRGLGTALGQLNADGTNTYVPA